MRRRGGSRPGASRRCTAQVAALREPLGDPKRRLRGLRPGARTASPGPWPNGGVRHWFLSRANGAESVTIALAGLVRLLVGEAPAQGVQEGPFGLVALLRQGRLEVGDERLAKLGVRFRPGDDPVEFAAGERQFLRRANPRFGRRWKGSDQLSKSVFIECAHTLTCPPD